MTFFDEQTLAYWQELRGRLTFVLVFFLLSFFIAYALADYTYYFISWPVRHFVEKETVVLSIIDTLTTPLRISWSVAWLVSVPVFFYQAFAFLLPAMYPTEKKWFLFIMLSSTLLYYIGVMFAFMVMVPFFVYYLVSMVPTGVSYMPDMKMYVDFTLSVSLTFGWIFELPVAMLILGHVNLVNAQMLRDFRKYFILLAFIVGMLLTPPDVVSQCMVALPICFVYELGLWLLRYREKWQHYTGKLSTV